MKLTGWFAAIALVTSSAALAEKRQQPQQQQEQIGAGGAGQAQMMGPQEITGEVVRVERNQLYLRHQGIIVPLRIEQKTQFGGGLTKEQLREGQQVRASFTVQDQVNNVATRIQPMGPGRGGAGMEQQMPEEQPQPQPEQQPY